MPNRLEKENFTYLQKHKDNPVDWWPWCDEALIKAEKENKAIFIFIGYSSCHLCNVMENNVFQNQECADILNNNFICIKVDREERPDIDKHFQEVHMLLNNRAGGWPTSIFCTPQNKPFFARTYIALESQTEGIEGMGFKELTKLIATKVQENDMQLFKNAEEVEDFLEKKKHPTQATVLNKDFVKNFMHQVKSNFQTKDGGFSVAPKFPHASTLNTLMLVDKLNDDKSAKAMLTQTLDAMKQGGFYDVVDGGFFRYATDSKWEVPHFEKTLYDNALLCETYANAYLTYNDTSYLEIAKEIADFWHTCMTQDKLMYSASGGEGLRKQKTYPSCDKKIQTSWSSMMIKSLFTLGQIDTKYTLRAQESLDALMKILYVDSQLYHTTLIHKSPKVGAFLEDYAYLGWALIHAYKCTKDEMYLIHAQRFANTALEEFYTSGAWNFSNGTFETTADIYDNTSISPVSIMVDLLLSLGTLLKDEKYTHFAFKTMEYNSYSLGRTPVHSPHMLGQMLRYLKGNTEIKSF
ncbi:thioredoxin domain-containing protein [Sulfurimonas sp. SAG-AH-194-I05]|nr:DUF255 domain-containing protein [Sulfurimonas sp. SAG-AH-194-I05]MDF1875476.1 thioredoxin domain-containing protein [Sulfurimonas sp. SAG-AH-194-I05]